MCVSTLTVPGSILRDAKWQEPEQQRTLVLGAGWQHADRLLVPLLDIFQLLGTAGGCTKLAQAQTVL